MSAADRLSRRAIALNDARLEGRIPRGVYAAEVVKLDGDVLAAGLTWDEIPGPYSSKPRAVRIGCGCQECLDAHSEGEELPEVLSPRGCECHGDVHCAGPMGHSVYA